MDRYIILAISLVMRSSSCGQMHSNNQSNTLLWIFPVPGIFGKPASLQSQPSRQCEPVTLNRFVCLRKRTPTSETKPALAEDTTKVPMPVSGTGHVVTPPTRVTRRESRSHPNHEWLTLVIKRKTYGTEAGIHVWAVIIVGQACLVHQAVFDISWQPQATTEWYALLYSALVVACYGGIFSRRRTTSYCNNVIYLCHLAFLVCDTEQYCSIVLVDRRRPKLDLNWLLLISVFLVP